MNLNSNIFQFRWRSLESLNFVLYSKHKLFEFIYLLWRTKIFFTKCLLEVVKFDFPFLLWKRFEFVSVRLLSTHPILEMRRTLPIGYYAFILITKLEKSWRRLSDLVRFILCLRSWCLFQVLDEGWTHGWSWLLLK